MRLRTLLPLLLILAAPAAKGQPASADDVLRAHIKAAGGEEALSAISDRYARGEITVDTPMGPVILGIEQWVVYPGYMLAKQTTITAPPEIPEGMLNQKLFLTPDGGWVDAAQLGGRTNVADLPGPQAASLQQQRRGLSAASDELVMLQDDSTEVTLGEPATVRDVDVYVVEVGGEAPSRRMYAKDTGLLFATETTGPMGPVRIFFSDYRTVSGIRVPFVMEQEAGGQSVLITFSEQAFDRGLTPEAITAAAEAQ